MIEILAFLMWFMPQRWRLAIACKIGTPYRHTDSENTIWVVGKRTAFLGRAKFTVSP
jgi:hypothetical protein